VKVLRDVDPTPEQLQVILDPTPGFWLIRGAAGSGKTTTALLRLRFLTRFWRERRADLGLAAPVRILVLTFNRTLRGYISELAEQQILAGPDLELTVSTFGHWAIDLIGESVVTTAARDSRLLTLGRPLGVDSRFLLDEVDYALGRFLAEDLKSYLVVRREGRGQAPRMERPLRERLLNEVIAPYQQWKHGNGQHDWNDLAVFLAQNRVAAPYDVVIVDEAQDFSANQVRAIVNHVSDDEMEHSTTFIRDSVQRIYPRAFTWREVGITFPPPQNVHLRTNHRNTKQIAAFARSLVEGLEAVEDGALPDFTGCTRDGPLPIVLRGEFSAQTQWTLDWLRALSDGEEVAFLHPLGWFRYLRPQLRAAGLSFVEITKGDEWPTGPERVALSTMHSAKGLEFDHVIVLGLNAEVVPHGEDEHDAQLENHRRLLAMALGRARDSVIVGYKPQEAASLVRYFERGTYEEIDV
jgi:superfamily I DNA/RNA helicase